MERNKLIFKMVLDGYSYKEVAIIYGLTSARVRQLVMNQAWKIREDLKIESSGKRMMCRGSNLAEAYSLKDLREHRNRILTILGFRPEE